VKQLFLLALLLPALAWAEVTPQPGRYDPRVRVVEYNPQDVVTLTTYYGVSTHIRFGEGEVVEDRSIGAGDPEAWFINVSGNKNNLFVKPKQKYADMNMTVITNKRVYQFALHVDPRPLKDLKTWRSNVLTYSLSFTYPEEERARKLALAREEDVNGRLMNIKGKLADAKKEGQNFDYWVAGADQVSPTGARDDGRFTYLTFSNNRDMPAIYTVDADGSEALVNTNVDGNTIAVHRVVRKLILRKGQYAACVVTKAFNPDGGTDNASGTIAPDVKRYVKEAKR
jgi:type IV secretion system protein VirB9